MTKSPEQKTETTELHITQRTIDGEIRTSIRTTQHVKQELIVRGQWDADRQMERGGAISMITLTISKRSGGYRVTYAWKNGNAWSMRKQSKTLFATERTATVWAAARWDVLMTWLRMTTPASSSSIDIVTMR